MLALCRLKAANGTCPTCVDGLCQVRNGVTLDERLLFRKWNGEMTGGSRCRRRKSSKGECRRSEFTIAPVATTRIQSSLTSPHYATPRGPAKVLSSELIPTCGCMAQSPSNPASLTLLARRLTKHNLTATTHLTFSPTSFQQMAGLTAYYNNRPFHHLYLSHDEVAGNSSYS